MTSLREKMKEDMILAGLTKNTQRAYLNAIVQLYNYYNKSPATLTEEELRNYRLHLKKKGMATNSYNVQMHGLRFFYCITLVQPLRKLELPTTKTIYKLPPLLSVDEVQEIIKAASNIKHRTLLMVVYGAGLRAIEAVNLRVQDIDSDRMTLHIRCAKGGKDRYVILSPVVHQALREYWKFCRFRDYIFFPSNRVFSNKPMTRHSASTIFRKCKARTSVTKDVGIHGLRHAFATHLLEAGTDIFTIKALLGHASIKSTARYLKFVPNLKREVCSPIDQLKL